MEIGEFDVSGWFEQWEPYELDTRTFGLVGSLCVGLLGSDLLLAQAKKYIEWFETAEVVIAKVVIGVALILVGGWAKIGGIFGGILKIVGIGSLVGAVYTWVAEKYGEDLGITTE